MSAVICVASLLWFIAGAYNWPIPHAELELNAVQALGAFPVLLIKLIWFLLAFPLSFACVVYLWPLKTLKGGQALGVKGVFWFCCTLFLAFVLTPVGLQLRFKVLAADSKSIQCWRVQNPDYIDGITRLDLPKSDQETFQLAECLGVESDSSEYRKYLQEEYKISDQYISEMSAVMNFWMRIVPESLWYMMILPT